MWHLNPANRTHSYIEKKLLLTCRTYRKLGDTGTWVHIFHSIACGDNKYEMFYLMTGL